MIVFLLVVGSCLTKKAKLIATTTMFNKNTNTNSTKHAASSNLLTTYICTTIK